MLCYVHVPFCVSKCSYCAFYSVPFHAEAASCFVRLIKAEIAQWGQVLGEQLLHTVYFGGGTPSILQPQQLAEIMAALAHYFVIDEQAEITLEANPESIIRPGLLDHLLEMGMNRLSLGAQSMCDANLRILGRPHDAEQVQQAVQLARDAGFANVSLDLIWGIPGQSVQAWAKDLQQILALEPDHLSTYALTLEEGTALTDQIEKGQWAMPEDEVMAEMYLQTVDFCQTAGLVHYEVSNFARPGKESCHNSGYWSGCDYLGLGPSAVSTIKDQRWTNPLSLDDYAQVIYGGKKREEEHLSQETRLHEEIMLALRTKKGLEVQKLFPNNQSCSGQEMSHILDQLQTQGLIQLQYNHLSLTSSGMLVGNSIIELVLDAMDRQHADMRIS